MASPFWVATSKIEIYASSYKYQTKFSKFLNLFIHLKYLYFPVVVDGAQMGYPFYNKIRKSTPKQIFLLIHKNIF